MQSESKLDEYHAEADRIVAETVALIPPELIDNVGFSESEPRSGAAILGTDDPNDPAWWQAREDLNLVSETDASADAAAAIASGLNADGWRESRVRMTQEGARIADGFRKDLDGEGWYIEVTWVMTRPDKAEVIEVLVVSPQTVRGDHDVPS
ncbi:hypothetical protein [Microbacterium sp. C7(2022)]|uniref:hypothetical protein n=1 Tax=Microbacterium sp. C7(2022) TaxID=2992759 RepID=UPI00237A83EC|nr:hypothetical protein [Microbacterium sp. C7(2022)]MDE0545174.1 hypothetical protein [Microbacterium sp. C7(2022)]